MKVICIDAIGTELSWTKRATNEPLVEGDIYTVVGSMVLHGHPTYRIAERMDTREGSIAWYRQDRFIPLSEIDEAELVNHQLQTA